jgi:hypothetical protein
VSGNPFAEKDNSNGEYRFNPNTVRAGLVATTIGLLLFGSLGIWAGVQEGFTSKGPIMSLPLCLALIGTLVHIARLSGRNLQISDDGILVRDKQGNQIGRLHWVELARVTERRRMAQLALWDKSGARRVLVDQQFENFALIRSRILNEYAKVFALKPLPIELRNSSPFLFEGLLFGLFTAFCSWGAWSTYQRGQTGLSVFFLCFAVATLLSLLNLYPQIAGPSELFGDRIVLRTLFKTEKIYKRSVSAVELGDVANPHSGTKFSFVILKITDGKPLRITSKFGGILEMYLTLRAWLAQSNA